MNEKGQVNVGTLVMLVVVAIVGIVLATAIFNQQAVLTTKQDVVNESDNVTLGGCYTATLGQVNTSSAGCNITLTNAPSGWKQADCPLESVSLQNVSGDALTITTQYTVNATTGVISLINASGVNASVLDTMLTDYTFCRDGYNKDTGSRSIAGLIGLFTVLALVAYMIYYGVKEWV